MEEVSKIAYTEAFGTQKRLPKKEALEKWRQLLPLAPFPESSKSLIDSWFEFLSTDGSESVSSDLWKCVWDFFMSDNLTGNDAEDFWPSTIDEFMEFYNAKHSSLKKPGNAFKLKSTPEPATESFSRTWYEDSPSNQKYVGLYNQGATCYLNSLIQTLFMTPQFRSALYLVYNNQVSETSTLCELQKLFAKLQLSDIQKTKAISTRDLTRSFGFSSEDSFTQHDVQELCRVLFDHLESTFRQLSIPNYINALYQGKVKDYVKCKECSHESQRMDTYLDMSLDIHNVTSLEQALINYASPEILTGPNAYFCGRCQTKVTALKGLSIDKVPPVLMFQLKRFVFNFQTMNRMKLNHSVTFPFVLNMNKFVSESKSTEHSESATVKSVLKPLFSTTDKLFSRTKKKKSDMEQSPGVPESMESLSQEIQMLEAFLQSEEMDTNFISVIEQLEHKRSRLAELQSSEAKKTKLPEEPKSNIPTSSKPKLNASEYTSSSNSHIQTVARVLLHYEQLIMMDKESPVRTLWEQMLQEKYDELETLLQGSSVSVTQQSQTIDKPPQLINQETHEALQQQIEDSLKDGPDVYQLLSVLVHAGSANGGHYYAFIKSFEDNLWYKFNDSSVYQVSSDIVKKESFGDKSMGSAYMLVYSRVTSDKPIVDIHVPDALKQATTVREHPIQPSSITGVHPIQMDRNVGSRLAQASVVNQEEDSQSDGVYDSMDEDDSVEPFDLSDDDVIVSEVEFQVQFGDSKTSFKLGKLETLQQATQKAYQLLIVASPNQRDFIPLHCVRLRLFDSINNIPSRTSFDGKEHFALNNLGFTTTKKFILETRTETGNFPQYGHDEWIVQIREYLPEKNCFSHSLFISVPHQASVAVLRAILQEHLGIQINQQRLFITLDRAPSVKLLEPNEDSMSLRNFGVIDGFTFFLEILNPAYSFLESPAMRKLLEDARNMPQQQSHGKRKEPVLKFKSNV